MNRIISYNIEEIRQLFENKNHLSNTYLSDLKILLKIAESKKDKIIFLALKQKNSIVAAGLFSAEERDLLESFGPKFDFSSLPQTHQTYASQLSDKNAKAFLTMSKAMQDKLYAAYLKSKVN